MKKILLILLILFVPILFLIFHDKGNEYLKPYVETYLESKLDQNMSVKVEHLKIDFDSVELNAVLNELTKVQAQGEVSLFTQKLDIDYTLKSDGFKTFDNKVDINGTVVGTFNNLDIKGEGETLNSHINYTLNIKDDVVNNIKVNIDNANIASLLELAAQPAYAKGTVDIDIDIPTLKDLNTEGRAKIILHSTTLNEKVFKKELKIDLPKKTIITANINSKISTEAFKLEGDIVSNIASIKLSKATYTLKNKEFLTDYLLTIPKLSKVAFVTKQKLNGKLIVAGQLIVKKTAFNLNGNTKSIGGETNFNFNAKKLNINMQDVNIAKLLHLINEKPYATGKLMAEVKLSNVKELKGTFKVKTKEAKTLNQILKKELNLDFGKSVAFSLNSQGDITPNLIFIQSKLNSDIINYRSNDMRYTLNDAKLSSTYLVDIPKLSQLNHIVGKSLKGSISINGEMNYHKTLEVSGLSKSLGGNIDFKLTNKRLTANMNDVPVEKLMYILDYPQVFKALIEGSFQYDISTKQGTFTSKLNNAQLLTNQLTLLVKQIRGLDLTKERYTQTHFNAVLNQDIININFRAKSKKVLLEIPTGYINKATNTIDAKYIVNIEGKDLGGKVKGNISKPKISIESSDFLKDKVINIIKDNIPEKTLKDLGLENLEPDAIKDTVKNLLGDLFK